MNKSPLEKVLEDPSSENKLELINMVKEISPALLELNIINKSKYGEIYSESALKNFLNSDDIVMILNFVKEVASDLIKFKSYHNKLKEDVKSRGLI